MTTSTPEPDSNDAPHSNKAGSDEPRSDEPRNDEPRNDEPRNDEPRNDEPSVAPPKPAPENRISGPPPAENPVGESHANPAPQNAAAPKRAVEPATAEPTDPKPTEPTLKPKPATPSATPSPYTGSWHRVLATLKPSLSRSQVLAAVLCGTLAFALVVQFRQTTTDSLSTLRDEELVRILDDLTARSDRLKAEEFRLEAAKRELESTSNGAAAVDQARKRLTELSLLAGTIGATGPGVNVTITDPQNSITPYQLLGAVQELRDAGAEAIQINNQRIVANTAFTRKDGHAAINNQIVKPPYQITAIGDAKTLATALQIRGGLKSIVEKNAGAGISIQPETKVIVTAVVAEKNT